MAKKISDLEDVVLSLKADKERRDDLESKMRRLSRYNTEYQEALADYAAKKSSGKYAQRPRKSPAHLDLEAEVQD